MVNSLQTHTTGLKVISKFLCTVKVNINVPIAAY